MGFVRHCGKTTVYKIFAVIAAACIALAAPAGAAAGASGAATDEPSSWAAEEAAKAKEYGLVPITMYHSFTSNITREDFCRLVMALYVKIDWTPLQPSAAQIFTDTQDKDVLNAYSLGIVRGIGGGLFAPHNEVTRQEMAVMLYNAINALNGATGRDILKSASSQPVFADRGDAAEWALPAINALRGGEIMLGDDKNRFNPLDNTTKEMAFILMNRIYLIYSGLDATKVFPAAYSGDILAKIKGTSLDLNKVFYLIVDVYEPYHDAAIADLTKFLDGEPFRDGAGKNYYIDKSESLRESVLAGYSGGPASGGNYYPIYVFITEDPPYKKLYLIINEDFYRFYTDVDKTEPLKHKTFGDVIFPVDHSYAYPDYYDPDVDFWRISLSLGTIIRVSEELARD